MQACSKLIRGPKNQFRSTRHEFQSFLSPQANSGWMYDKTYFSCFQQNSFQSLKKFKEFRILFKQEIDITALYCLFPGTCKDLIAAYKCDCEPGYEGKTCETEINECERYQPCQHGTCMDQINDYKCYCDTEAPDYKDIWGDKNCSVELIGKRNF